MKSIIILIAYSLVFLNLSFTTHEAPTHSNILAKTTWQIDGPAFISLDKESYTLTSLSKKNSKNYYFQFGHSVTFSENGEFSGSYSAPCGNDCFTSVYGTYKFVKANQIEIFITNVEQNGFCTGEIDIKNKTMGIFEIGDLKKNQRILKRIS